MPDYFKWLNKNEQVWVTPVNHFGSGYGIVDPTQSCVSFCSNTDGNYMALIIGTRKDTNTSNWYGVERNKSEVIHTKI